MTDNTSLIIFTELLCFYFKVRWLWISWIQPLCYYSGSIPYVYRRICNLDYENLTIVAFLSSFSGELIMFLKCFCSKIDSPRRKLDKTFGCHRILCLTKSSGNMLKNYQKQNCSRERLHFILRPSKMPFKIKLDLLSKRYEKPILFPLPKIKHSLSPSQVKNILNKYFNLL